jgi:hypothetical protein
MSCDTLFTTIWEIQATGVGLQPLVVMAATPDDPNYIPGLHTPTPRRHGYSLYHYLAHEFRPHLRYDSTETYRPLDVDKFFAEQNDQLQPLHQACSTSGCGPLTSTTDLAGKDWIDIAGDGNADNYYSPYSVCTQGGLRDCDAGIRSVIYYWNTSPTESASYYTDYWIFYRYNDWPGGIGGDHEGDWESVTIADSATNPYTFDFASFSQHGHWYSYLRENLSCDGQGPGSCGTTPNPSGRRVDVYVPGVACKLSGSMPGDDLYVVLAQ